MPLPTAISLFVIASVLLLAGILSSTCSFLAVRNRKMLLAGMVFAAAMLPVLSMLVPAAFSGAVLPADGFSTGVVFREIGPADDGQANLAALLLSTLPNLMPVFYLVGVATVAARYAIHYLRASSLRAGGSQLCSTLEGRRPVFISNRTSQPLAVGIFNGAILLPGDAPRWPATQLRHALKHELHHLKERDLLWLFFANVATVIWWFNPLIWLARDRLRDFQEYDADSAMIISGELPSQYARTLLSIRVADFNSGTAASASLAEMSKMKRRIEAITHNSRHSGEVTMFSPRTCNIICLVSALLLSSLVPDATIQARSEKEDLLIITEDSELPPPKLIHRVDPDYPNQARVDRASPASVKFQVLIDLSGMVEEVTVLEDSHPEYEFAEEAIRVVREWKFKPYEHQGETVPVKATLTMHWSLLY